MKREEKMCVEVWSDIMCPFCFIGKSNLEAALTQTAFRDQVEVFWKSFQLDPEVDGRTYSNEKEYLAKSKGLPPMQIEAMLQSVAQSAQAAGVSIDFDCVVVANTMNAHRLLHAAQTVDNQTAYKLKGRLFEAHFQEGQDVSDEQVLQALARSVQLDSTIVDRALQEKAFDYEVNQDVLEARNIGVRGVPFFVFDRKYAISGAQPVEVFVQTLERAFSEWTQKQQAKLVHVNEGPSCSPEEGCS